MKEDEVRYCEAGFADGTVCGRPTRNKAQRYCAGHKTQQWQRKIPFTPIRTWTRRESLIQMETT